MKFASYIFQNQLVLCPESLVSSTMEIKHPPAPISTLPQLGAPLLNTTYPYSKDLQNHLQGKHLLLNEIPYPLQLIQAHYLQGYIQYEKGISYVKSNYQCHRCGNKTQRLFARFHCARCEQKCTYCRKCIITGRVSECTPLLSWTGSISNYPATSDLLRWEGTLSPGQQKASETIFSIVGERKELLIWAVCGAGKTEVLFAGIEKALSQGLRVLIATPRKDVVLELAPRLKQAFPSIEVISLYGGSKDAKKQGQLVIATSHQLIRYKNYFDLVIIDEVDAFPFSHDPMLPFAVNKAKKEAATTVFLTATPEEDMKNRIKKNELPVIKIPRRYHGYPLPVPQFKWAGNIEKQLKKQRLPNNLYNWLKQKLHLNEQAFLFVPTIETLEKTIPLLKPLSTKIEGVHSEDPHRKEKIEKFRAGEIPILVTTTILERGVTIPKVHVAVLSAEHQIFTESALVQIAGRAGRSATHPTGDVIFFHYGKTKAMVEARHHIIGMNNEGS